MSDYNTISAAAAPTGTRDARFISYEVPGSDRLILNYVTMTYSLQHRQIARQNTHRIYRFSFRFILAASDQTDLRNQLNRVERVLNMRGGTLIVEENGIRLFESYPANISPIPSGPQQDTGGSTRPAIMADIEWGPRPVALISEGVIGHSAFMTWVVEITTAAEDAYRFRDLLVLGVNASVIYSISQNHYTRRTVSGQVFIANFGRSGQDLNRSIYSQADLDALRLSIVQGPNVQFMDPIRIPPNFRREVTQWAIDESENILSFTIVDQELYRLYPALITDADAQLSVRVKPTSALSAVYHHLVGYCEAPRDVPKILVLTACWEIIQDATPFLGRSGDDLKSMVLEYTFTNSLYSNRISFDILMATPFGAWDFATSLGIGTFKSELFFPPGTAGSAGLYGSAYRTEEGVSTNRNTDNSSVKPEDPEQFSAAPSKPLVQQNAEKAFESKPDLEFAKDFFYYQSRTWFTNTSRLYVAINQAKRRAAASGDSANVARLYFRNTAADIIIALDYYTLDTDLGPSTTAEKTATPASDDLVNAFQEGVSAVIPLENIEAHSESGTRHRSAFGNKTMHQQKTVIRIKLTPAMLDTLFEVGAALYQQKVRDIMKHWDGTADYLKDAFTQLSDSKKLSGGA